MTSLIAIKKLGLCQLIKESKSLNELVLLHTTNDESISSKIDPDTSYLSQNNEALSDSSKYYYNDTAFNQYIYIYKFKKLVQIDAF